jgi:hypothetical protein
LDNLVKTDAMKCDEKWNEQIYINAEL